jgi:hypothetical protein
VKTGRHVRSQEGTQAVDQQVCHLVCPRTQLNHRNAFGQGIKSHPQPKHLRVTTQPRAPLIQLPVWDLHLREGALMQGLAMGPGTRASTG